MCGRCSISSWVFTASSDASLSAESPRRSSPSATRSLIRYSRALTTTISLIGTLFSDNNGFG